MIWYDTALHSPSYIGDNYKVGKELMRKLDLALSLEPGTSVENLMSQVEVWPHLPGKHLQARKADTMIPVMSPSNHSQRICHPNRGYTLKFWEITPTVGTSGPGKTCPCVWKANRLLGCREQHAQVKGWIRRVIVALCLQIVWHNGHVLEDGLGLWILWRKRLLYFQLDTCHLLHVLVLFDCEYFSTYTGRGW